MPTTTFCTFQYDALTNRAKISTFDYNILTTGQRQIHRCQRYQYLGVTLDECLTMKQNFNTILKRFSHKIYQFGKIKKFLDIHTRVLVYKQTVLPLTEYVSFSMCLNNKNDVNKLQILQNRALRMCFNIQNPRDVSVVRLHTMANVDMLDKRRMIQLMSIIYDIAPSYQQDIIALHNTRTAAKNNIKIGLANTQIYTRSPYYVGGQVWNSLPKQTQELKTKKQFKGAISNLL